MPNLNRRCNGDNEYKLKIIYFYLTEGCNLKCRHCWLAPKYDRDGTKYKTLNFEFFKSIIKQALPLGLTKVKLTGGEPLLHPRIKNILKFIRDKGIRLTMETNGVLCSKEIAGLISSCNKPFVAISLDGARRETHENIRGVEGCFDAAIEGFKNMKNAGIRPQIIMTIMRHNYNQVEDLVRLAESIGAGSVKFNIVQPTSRGKKMHESGETLSIRELIELGRRIEKELSKTSSIRLHFTYPHAFQSLKSMLDEDAKGCMVCGILKIIGVLPDGSYALCGVGEVIPELIFGRAEKDSLEKVWNENSVIKEIREGMPEKLQGICRECLMKYVCRGSCIAQNYYDTRNLWAPFWFCNEADKLGLFPETRKAPVFS